MAETARSFMIVAMFAPTVGAMLLVAAAALPGADQPTRLHAKAPEFAGGPWLNTERAIRLKDRAGKVTIVEFWTYG